MTADQSAFIPYLVAWAGLLTVLVLQSWFGRNRSAGLVLAYCFQIWLFYWLPSMLHCLPWSELPSRDATFLGFQQSTYALAALCVGTIAAGPLFAASRRPNRLQIFTPDPRLPGAYISSGLFSYIVLSPVLSHIPSVSALAGVGQQLIIVGFCLAIWRAWCEGSILKAVSSLGPLFIMPIVTVVGSGFLGYGLMIISVVFLFCTQFFRPRHVLLMVCAVMGYLGLSLYVTYMRDRTEIRESVWGGASLSARVSRFQTTLTNFELFDSHNPTHLNAIDGRLNQAVLVGAAVTHLKDTGDFANGASIKDAMIAMIPRLLWPGKTVFAGSSDWVTRFTGIIFADGTSVGIGQVLEFYGNFGELGVVIGFTILGLILGGLDMAAAACLERGDWQGFAFFFVVGVALLNAGGSLVEVTATVLASILLMRITNTLLAGYQKIIHHRHPVNAPVAGQLQ